MADDPKSDETYSEEETVARREAALKRMLATPHKEALPIAEPIKTTELLAWPTRLAEQVVAVTGVVEQAGRPIDSAAVARAFKAKQARSVRPVPDALAGMGRLRKLEGDRYAA